MPERPAAAVAANEPPPTLPLLTLLHVSKWIGTRQILRDITLDVAPGAITCILGPSGGGKTTLLRCINLLDPIDDGEVRFAGSLVSRATRGRQYSWATRIARRMLYDGAPDIAVTRELFVSPHVHRQAISTVFQEFNLWPDRTVLENLIEGPVVARGELRRDVETRAEVLLARLELAKVAHRYPHQLSGGQRQRIAIARAFLMNSRLVLADEITSALDPELVAGVLDALRELAASGTSMIVVTHHIEFARTVADHVVFMDEGAIIESGRAANVLEAPRQERTKRFLQSLRAAR
jgi:polar amino acid transport system ATP-binding protein